MSGIPFLKMHGLGNDFVVIDARRDPVRLDDEAARSIADRRTGIGCDQLIVIEPATGPGDAFMRIRNADGGEVEACGNATRCIGAFLMTESGRDAVSIETAAGLLRVNRAEGGMVSVDMGVPRTGWREIPLSREQDTLHLDLSLGPLQDAVAVSMGNPHAVFFVPDAEAVDLAALGPRLEHDPLFPDRANIGVAQVMAPDRLRLRVWERGAGITPACGTGACAAVVAGARRGITGRSVAVDVDGGTLMIEWSDGADGRVRMTGPAAISFSGTWSEVRAP